VYRSLCVLVVALSAAAGLSACSTKVGSAAVVGGQRISERDVARETLTTAPDSSTARSVVLAYLVKQKLYEQVDAKVGVSLSDVELSAIQTQALSAVLGATLPAGQPGVNELAGLLAKQGISRSFAKVFLRSIELEYASNAKLKATSLTDLQTKVRALDIRVKISPRYGSWDAAIQDLEAPATPSFLKLKPTASPAA
jgi:hypothetical protein